MSELQEVIMDEGQETEEEGTSVHIVCCVTESKNIDVNRSLCGIVIDTEGPPDYRVDHDCRRCDILDMANFCPTFGECQDF